MIQGVVRLGTNYSAVQQFYTKRNPWGTVHVERWLISGGARCSVEGYRPGRRRRRRRRRNSLIITRTT